MTPPPRPGVAAIVVTFNRQAWLARCLQALRAQTVPPRAIYIVDNASSDGTPRRLLEAGEISTAPPEGADRMFRTDTHREGETLAYLRLPDNRGGAGGFEAGVSAAHADGWEWCWLMDDDCLPENACLEQMLAAAQTGGPGNIYLANVRAIEDREVSLWADKVWRRPVPIAPGVAEVWSGTFNGYLAHHSVIARIGAPRGDLFIYSDDIEYTHRARRAGARVLVVGDAVLRHPGRIVSPAAQFRLCFNRFNLYYSIRNMRFVEGLGIRILTPRRRLMACALLLLHAACFRVDLIRLTLRAWRDGAAGRLGRCDDL